MKEVKKYLLPALLMIWPYMLLIFNNIKSGTLLRIMMDFCFASTLFVIIGNMIYAFKYKSDNAFYELSLIKSSSYIFLFMYVCYGSSFINLLCSSSFNACNTNSYNIFNDYSLVFDDNVFNVWSKCDYQRNKK